MASIEIGIYQLILLHLDDEVNIHLNSLGVS